MSKVRFQNFEIWQMAMKVANSFFYIAENLDTKRLNNFSDQFRRDRVSVLNDIAEIS